MGGYFSRICLCAFLGLVWYFQRVARRRSKGNLRLRTGLMQNADPTNRYERSSGHAWLSAEHVGYTIRKQDELQSHSSTARSNFVHEMIKLQQRAEFLFDLQANARLEILSKGGQKTAQNSTVAISQLREYLEGNNRGDAVDLVVVIVPYEFVSEGEDPTLLQLIRRIDGLLCEALGGRLVFQIVAPNHHFQLDSSEIGMNERNKKK
jgi:hypothetical protein